MDKGKIYTIGHSTRTLEEFLAMLKSFGIRMLVDIRNYPGSRLFSHFNKEYLEAELAKNGIKYLHISDLGGRRKPRPDSINTAWKLAAFRGYADYMETKSFRDAVKLMTKFALKTPVAYMCAEALWWSCHRALVSDYLKFNGWKVIHITDKGKSSPHTYTSAARIIKDRLTYGIE
ncbi:MAG TPA: DUF488 domain-containing protein [Bacteroidia bacterium]|jgi:uncharacterized protein (DUF488 family)